MGRSQIHLEPISFGVANITALKCVLDHRLALLWMEREHRALDRRGECCYAVNCVNPSYRSINKAQGFPCPNGFTRPAVWLSVFKLIETPRHIAPQVIERPKYFSRFT